MSRAAHFVGADRVKAARRANVRVTPLPRRSGLAVSPVAGRRRVAHDKLWESKENIGNPPLSRPLEDL